MIAPKADNADTHIVTQPILILEVLSKGTAKVNKTDKLREYRKISTLQHYLIPRQDEAYIELYSRHGVKWLYEGFDTQNPLIELKAFEVTVDIKAIYEGIEFES